MEIFLGFECLSLSEGGLCHVARKRKFKKVVERDPELKLFYRRKLVQKGLGKARVAAARKLGIRPDIKHDTSIESY